MPKRTVCVQRPAHLTVKNKSLVIENENGRCRIPLEDIWVLILEERSISVGVALLSSLADAGIGTMICGENHMPNGLYLPLGAHSRHSAIVEDQLAIPKPLKKQLWKRIVQSKIGNQARCLDFLGIDGVIRCGWKHVRYCRAIRPTGKPSRQRSTFAGLYPMRREETDPTLPPSITDTPCSGRG